MKLEGKVAIITGAGSGMGAEEAKMFAAEGARVVITDINAEACRKVADEIGEAAIAIEHDVANEEGWGVVVATTLEKFGKIDILLNNAGLTKADTFISEERRVGKECVSTCRSWCLLDHLRKNKI